MRTWLEIFTIIADRMPGDIDKLTLEEAELVRRAVAAIDNGETMCFESKDRETLDKAMDKLAPQKH